MEAGIRFSRLEKQLIRSAYTENVAHGLIAGGFDPSMVFGTEDEPIDPEDAMEMKIHPPGPTPVELATLLMLAAAIESPAAFDQLSRLGNFATFECDNHDWVAPVTKSLARFLKGRGESVSNPTHDHLRAYSSARAYHVFLSPTDLGDGNFGFETRKKRYPTVPDDVVLECISSRRPTISISGPTEGILPSWTRQFSKQQFRIPGPSKRILTKLLHMFCLPASDVSAVVPGELTPMSLAIAFADLVDWRTVIHRLETLPIGGRTESDAPVVDRPTLDDLIGFNGLKAWGQDLKSDVDAINAHSLGLAELPRGLLLSGPPGTGKTRGAKLVAGYAGLPVVFGSVGRWLSVGDGHLGTFCRAMRNDFAKAARSAPAALIIDEIDAFPTRGKDDQHWFDAALTALLEAMDGLDSAPGVVTIGICNDPSKLDPALIRSGRMDHKITVDLPDVHDLAAMFRRCLRPSLQDVDFMPIAVTAIGGTIADVDRICKDARRIARTADRDVTLDDLRAVVEKTGYKPSDDDLRRTATHEAGHALVAHIEGVKLRWVSVSTAGLDGNRGSVATDLSGEDWSLDRIKAFVRHLLAGHAAEEVLMNEATVGSGNDLAMATDLIARAAATEGLMGSLLWHSPTQVKEVSRHPGLAPMLDATLKRMHKEASDLIAANRGAMFRLRDALLESRFLEPEAVAALLRDVEPRAHRETTERNHVEG